MRVTLREAYDATTQDSAARDQKMTQAPKYKRSARNYLLDPQFQLKYTGLLVAIAVVLATGLGVLLWRTSAEVVAQSQNTVDQGKETVKQGTETVERGKQVIEQSRKVSQVVAMNIDKNYGDQPELAKTFKSEADKDDAKLVEEQKRLEQDAAFLAKRSSDLEKQAQAVRDGQRNLFIGLVGAMVALVVGIGIAGIIFTHKIAGPIFKMKRLMREVGSGKLILREKLRKGDELQHFFEAFEQMVETMRGHQKKEIARVDGIIEALESDKADGVAKLKELRHDMQDHLEA